ncbi:germacradienol/geosmin synthase [Nonomuraea solani]|uniref:Terpene synthase n=1 Tax=Nonomuraea solani TaxID=1144553 RepID=A0A1H6ERW9_9ACTN|nr:terpene synthase family protein [Nonomuraea solani]SEG99756.1 germacradienol/geosmin synthase [Nonomuraea solani]
MPQNMEFVIPFRSSVSTYLKPARRRHLGWVREHGLVRSEAGWDEYLSWDLPQAAARTYPGTQTADDMFMFMNWFSLAFLFDDQFDATSEGRVEQIAHVSREMITIPFRPAGAPPEEVCPITLAWVEVWAQLSMGMSESWRNRFASSWARFLAAHAQEVRISAAGENLDLAAYIDLRRRSVGIHHSIDAAERSCRTEVPVQIQAHPLMQNMRAAAADVIAYMNDLQSLEREERRGDSHNLVTVLMRHRGCSRAAAIDEAVRMTADRLAAYLHLESRVPRLCDELGMAQNQRAATDVGVAGIRNWIRGNYDWARNTGRYTANRSDVVAAVERQGRGSVDDLLTPKGSGSSPRPV